MSGNTVINWKVNKYFHDSLYLFCILGDEEIRILKERLEETEKAMQMIVSHMAAITTLPANDLTKQSSSVEPKKSKDKPSKKSKRKAKEEEKVIEEKSAKNQDSSSSDDDETDEKTSQEDIQPKIENVKALPLAQESWKKNPTKLNFSMNFCLPSFLFRNKCKNFGFDKVFIPFSVQNWSFFRSVFKHKVV